MKHYAMALALTGVVGLATPVFAEQATPIRPRGDRVVMFDEFETGNVEWSMALAPCYRPENVEIDQQANVRVGRWAVQLTVNPRAAERRRWRGMPYPGERSA